MRNLWRNWSKAQRLTAVIVITVGLAGIVWTYAAGTSETWQVLLETRLGRNSDELRELLARLDTEEILWQLKKGANASKFEIEVRSGLDYRKALLLASENGLVDETSGTGMGHGMFDGGLLDTSEKMRTRREQDESRTVKKQIRRWCSSVAEVELWIKYGKVGRFATDKDTPGTALVLLRIKDSVSHLGAMEAVTIGNIVSQAFEIEAKNIHIVDNYMRDYSEGSEGLKEILARDLQAEVRSEIREVIESLYLGVYAKEQFRLGVIVESIEAQRPGNGAADPGVGAYVPAEAGAGPGEQAAESGTGSNTVDPAPRLARPGREAKYKVNVNLVFDIGAVKRVLEDRDDLLEARGNPATTDFAARIDEYQREQEEFLSLQLPLDNVRVTVNTEAFFNSQMEEAAALPFFPGFFNRDWDLRWLSDPYIYGGGGLALVLLLFFCLLGIRGRRKRRFETEVADAIRADACRETLLAVDQAGRLTRNSPEISMSVVKMWLSDSLDPVVEMSNPATGGAESQLEATPSVN